MRRLLSVSVLALSLAMASSVHAEDWFRLNMSSPILFGSTENNDLPDDGEPGLPPDHGQNSGDRPVITASGGMFRALASVSIPVLVDSGSGGYVLQDDHPDLEVVAGAADGEFTLEGSLLSSSTVRLTAMDMLYTPSEPVDLAIDVYDPLVASGPASLGTIRTGSPIAFDLTTTGDIGDVAWELLGINGLSVDADGSVTGIPSAGSYSIAARATDAFDGAKATTVAFPLVVAPNLSASFPNIETSANSPFSIAPTIAGKIGAMTWEVADGATPLPGSVSLDPSTGRLSGQIETTITGLRLAVTDAFDEQNATTNAFSISVIVDTVPDAFTVPSQTGVEPRWEVISAPVTISGSMVRFRSFLHQAPRSPSTMGLGATPRRSPRTRASVSRRPHLTNPRR